jgi:hypothetical protein
MKSDAPDLDPDDAPVEAVASPTATPAGDDEIASGLLHFIGEVTKLAVVLHELDDESWAPVAHRLESFKQLVAMLPDAAPKAKRRVGFGTPKPPKAKGRRKR